MPLEFPTAKREQVKLRAALIGPTGSGKTRAALEIATRLGKTAVIDSENGRARLYSDRYEFGHANITDTTPEGYRAALKDAVAAGFEVVVIDGLSPEWQAVLGDADRFGNWKNVRPRHNDFVKDLTWAPVHVIVTMRAKMKYEVSEDERGKQKITPLGVGPIQDEQLPYEFDVVGYLDVETHQASFMNRCDALVGQTRLVDAETVQIISDWLNTGDEAAPPATIEQHETLVQVITWLDENAPLANFKWSQIVEKAATRDYARPIAALTEPQIAKLITDLEAEVVKAQQAAQDSGGTTDGGTVEGGSPADGNQTGGSPPEDEVTKMAEQSFTG